MSFDLGVYACLDEVDPSKIREAYKNGSSDWETTEIFEEFCDKVFQKYPVLNQCSEVQLEDSPWAFSEKVGGAASFGFVSGNKGSVALSYIIEQANEHDLIIYDPQADEVHFQGQKINEYPKSSKKRPRNDNKIINSIEDGSVSESSGKVVQFGNWSLAALAATLLWPLIIMWFILDNIFENKEPSVESLLMLSILTIFIGVHILVLFKNELCRRIVVFCSFLQLINVPIGTVAGIILIKTYYGKKFT